MIIKIKNQWRKKSPAPGADEGGKWRILKLWSCQYSDFAPKKPLHFRESQWGIYNASSLRCNGFFIGCVLKRYANAKLVSQYLAAVRLPTT